MAQTNISLRSRCGGNEDEWSGCSFIRSPLTEGKTAYWLQESSLWGGLGRPKSKLTVLTQVFFMAKITRLVYQIPNNTPYTIDLAKDLSVVHRKLHRQKMTYTVLSGQIKESSNSSFYFKTAPPCWTTNVAIRRAFNTWRKVYRELYKKSDIQSPKWSDFKIRLDRNHTDSTTLQPLFDTDEQGGNSRVYYSMGEWNYSTLVQPKLIDPDSDGGLEFDANADNWDMHIVGDTYGSSPVETDHDDPQSFLKNITSVGVINSWYNSRSIPIQAIPGNAPSGILPQKEHGVRTDPLSNLFDVQDDDNEQISVIESENDQAPYNYGVVPGSRDGDLQLVAFADNAGASDTTIIPGFQAACGLIRVQGVGNNGAILMLDVLTEGERI